MSTRIVAAALLAILSFPALASDASSDRRQREIASQTVSRQAAEPRSVTAAATEVGHHQVEKTPSDHSACVCPRA